MLFKIIGTGGALSGGLKLEGGRLTLVFSVAFFCKIPNKKLVMIN
jgi:hypothetical protein